AGRDSGRKSDPPAADAAGRATERRPRLPIQRAPAPLAAKRAGRPCRPRDRVRAADSPAAAPRPADLRRRVRGRRPGVARPVAAVVPSGRAIGRAVRRDSRGPAMPPGTAAPPQSWYHARSRREARALRGYAAIPTRVRTAPPG